MQWSLSSSGFGVRFPTLTRSRFIWLLSIALPIGALAEGVVTSCNETDLRAALTGGGTVTFACDGVIALASTLDITNNTVIDATGRDVTISGGNAVRVFSLAAGTETALTGLKIVNGRHVDGAGILNSGVLTLRRCTLSSNVAMGGVTLRGGALLNQGTLDVTDCTFVTNRVEGLGYGGAIHNMGIFSVRQCTFVGNSATYGGAIVHQIFNAAADVPAGVTNCTFWGNESLSPGVAAGILNHRTSTQVTGRISVLNCTFVDNIGGPVGPHPALGGFTWVANTILGPTSSSFIDGGNNLISHPTELRLGPLADNGGPTWTIAPQPDSPAIDQGNNGFCPPTDQRGVPRPYGPACDIGAFEAQTAPTPAFLQFSAGAFNVNEASNTATISVVRIGNSGGAASVRYSASDGTATDLYDYTSVTGLVSLAAGQTQTTFTVSVKNDFAPEVNETINLALFGPTGAPSLGEPSTAVLTIIDDDPVQPGVMAFAHAAYSVSEASQAVLTIVRTGGTNGAMTVDFATADGTALAGSDYVATNGTLTFLDGQTSHSLFLQLVSDDVTEGPETFTVTLSNPGGGATIGSPASTAVTVVDGTHTITECNETALRAALSSGGRVTLACDGTIALTSPLVVSNGVHVDAIGRDVILTGNQSTRLFVVNPGATLSLAHLTLADGLALGTNGAAGQGGVAQPGGPGEGGAIYNDSGVFLATDCVFLRNKAEGGLGGPAVFFGVAGSGGVARGGAIYNLAGQVMLANCLLSANHARGGAGGSGNPVSFGGESTGGAIYSDGGYITLIACRLEGNLSIFGSGTRPGLPASGGAIEFASGTIRLACCILAGNESRAGVGPARGGALTQRGGSLEIADSILAANNAEGGGGTQRFSGGSAFGGGLCLLSGTALLDSSTLISNRAEGGTFTPGPGVGGAVYNAGMLQVRNCTIGGNEARAGDNMGYHAWGSSYGGAIYQSTGAVYLVHVTLADNAARATPGSTFGAVEQGGAIFSSTNGTVTLFNSIVANSPSGSNSFGVLIDGGHNLSSDASCNFTASGSLNNTDPKLGPLADYTGPTPTMALLAGSPAIDAAGSAACTPTDQRGRARPAGPACDMGAFESGEPYTVVGRVNGYVPPVGSGTVGNGTLTTQINAFGEYALHGLAPGVHTLRPECSLAVFAPKTRELNLVADAAGIDFASYRTNAIAISLLGPGAIDAVFAGEAGAIYNVQLSPGLPASWDPYATLTADTDGLIRWAETNSNPGNGRFFRVERP